MNQGDKGFRVAALIGATTLPLVLAAVTMSDVAGSGGLNPGSSDAELLEVFGDFRERPGPQQRGARAGRYDASPNP